MLALQDVLHENAWRDDVIRIDGAGLDQVLHFGDGDARGGRHHGIEVARRSPIDQITHAVAFPRLDEGEVGAQRVLEDVGLAVNRPRLLALGDERAVSRRREEAADAGAARPNPLGKRPLGHQLDLDLAAQELALELLVLADVGRDHFLDLPRLHEHAHAGFVHAGIVADYGEPAGPACVQRLDEVFGNAAEAEAAHHDRRPVRNDGDGFGRAGDHFVHGV